MKNSIILLLSLCILVFAIIPSVLADACCDDCNRNGIHCPNDSTISSSCDCNAEGGCYRCFQSLTGLSVFLIVFFPILIIICIFLCCRYISGCPCYYRRNESFPQMGVVHTNLQFQPAIQYAQPAALIASPMNGQPAMYAPYAQPAGSPVMAQPYSPQNGVPQQQYQQYPQQPLSPNAQAYPVTYASAPQGEVPYQGEAQPQEGTIVEGYGNRPASSAPVAYHI
jgi:hypothetical protein